MSVKYVFASLQIRQTLVAVSGLCPAGQIPYYHPLTSKTVKCNPSSIVSNCPSGYACSVSVTGAVWGFCCSQQVAGTVIFLLFFIR